MIDLVTPFPPKYLPQAWSWFADSPAFINRCTMLEGEFITWAVSRFSIGISLNGALVGIILIEPSLWTGQKEDTDCVVSFGFARRVWGKGLLGAVRNKILHHLFQCFPTLNRVTGYTSSKNRAAQRAASLLGCKEEGRMRDVFTPGEDVVIFGLTRNEFYGRQ